MASITSTGLGSGLNVEGLVTQLMSVEQRPLTLLQSRESKENTKLSSWGQIKSALSSLQAAAQALDSRTEFTTYKASISNADVATISADTSAKGGNYALAISQLADVQKIKSVGYAKTDTEVVDVSAGAQTLTLKVGTKSADITIDTSNNTLAGLRDAINNAKAGVTATIINDGSASSPYRLVLTGDDTGTANAFSLSGLSSLSYDASTATGTGLMQIQGAKDALFSVDGIAVTKSSNTISDVIEGVTLTLKAPTTSPTSISVAADNSVLQTKMSALVKAYNDLNSIVKVQTAYDAKTKTAGTLNGDSTARNLMSQIRSVLTSSVGDGTYSTLSSVGIGFLKDGSIALDSGKLQKALDNKDVDVAAIFVKDANSTGIASTLGSTVEKMLGRGGMVTARTDGINSTIKTIDKQMDSLTDRLTAVEKRYRAQFTALDKSLSSLKNTGNYLTQQLSALS